MVDVTLLNTRIGDKTILKDVSFKAEKGCFTALLGPNGSGKSTILKCLSGLWTGQWKNMMIDGKCRSSYGIKEFSRTVAYLSQHNPPVEGLTIRERVAYGRLPHKGLFRLIDQHDRHIVRTALEETDLIHMEDRFLTSLSGGELQRVHLAACLAQEPKLLLLDEPTNHLDIGHQYGLLALVKELVSARKMTVICVLHDMNQALRFADKAILLKEGRIIGAGQVSQVLNRNLIGETFGVESRVHTSKDHSYIEILG